VLNADVRGGHHLDEGGSIELDTAAGRRTFSILRLLEPQGMARVYGGNLVVMDIAAAEDVFTATRLVSASTWSSRATPESTRHGPRVEAVLPPGVHITTPAERKLDLHNVMRSFGMLLRSLGVVGLVIAYLRSRSTALSSGFESRGWQLGVLAAIGRAARDLAGADEGGAPPRARERPPSASARLRIGAHLLRSSDRDGAHFNLIAPDVRLVRGAAPRSRPRPPLASA